MDTSVDNDSKGPSQSSHLFDLISIDGEGPTMLLDVEIGGGGSDQY